VKPLEKAQLKNWRDYLEFEMANGSEKRVVVLFERCVIACALYEEFWMKVCEVNTCCVLVVCFHLSSLHCFPSSSLAEFVLLSYVVVCCIFCGSCF